MIINCVVLHYTIGLMLYYRLVPQNLPNRIRYGVERQNFLLKFINIFDLNLMRKDIGKLYSSPMTRLGAKINIKYNTTVRNTNINCQILGYLSHYSL